MKLRQPEPRISGDYVLFNCGATVPPPGATK
jgi:hypothetical protein